MSGKLILKALPFALDFLSRKSTQYPKSALGTAITSSGLLAFFNSPAAIDAVKNGVADILRTLADTLTSMPVG